jgi:uncharacterized SAM-binding protein YcdF (DUF218 family)
MIFFSKIITALLLPPGGFILLLLLLIFFVPRKIKIIQGIVVICLYSLSIQPVSDFLLKPLEDAYPPLQAVSLISADEKEFIPQAIVVLGSGTIQGSPEAGEGKDTLTSDAVKRAVYAFSLRKNFSVPFIFSGGKVFEYNQEPEAAAAGRLYDSLGLPAEKFIAESESRNTWENARETAKLGIKRAILVTSAYHMKRSVYCFENNGISVIPAPTDYKCARGRKYDIFSFLPSMESLKMTNLVLHEYIGLLYYNIAY